MTTAQESTTERQESTTESVTEQIRNDHRAGSAGPAAALGSADLQGRIVGLVGRLAAGTYELLVLIGEYDARGLWAGQGALSCAHWLAELSDIEISTARTQVRVAHALREFPGLDAATARGDLSYAKAKVLVAHLNAANVAALVDIAVRTPAGHLGAAIAGWCRRNEDPEVIDERHNEMRSVSWRTDGDGMVVLTARMTPEAGGAVSAVIEQAVITRGAPAGASLAQQRHDAFVAAMTRASGASGASGGSTGGSAASAVRAEVVIHVRGDGNTLVDGTPVSDHAVAGLLPDAFVSLLICDSERQPIDATPRRRTPTRRQRRVVDELHPECDHPGCHATAFLQYDHIEAYAGGGPTALANLQRLCGPHNREKQRRERDRGAA